VSGISCPYHGWTYDLEGKLRRRAHFAGPARDEEVDGIGLYAVTCGMWQNLIFINIDGDAPPLDEFMKPVRRQLEGYDLSGLVFATELTWKIASNWKFIYENYIEPYHVPWCHPALEAFTPATERVLSVDGPCFVSRATFEVGEVGRGAGLPHLRNLSKELSGRGTYIHLFPSCCLNLYPDHLAVFLVTPLGPDCTFERIVLFMPEESLRPEWEEGREGLLKVWRGLNEEDIGIVERQQRGRASPPFDGGILSPYWDAPTTHAFARQVVSSLLA
jgi:choline monooxygenase